MRIPGVRAAVAAVLLAAGGAVALTPGTSDAAAQRGSGGELIAFSGIQWGRSCVTAQIYLIGADGHGLRRLTSAGSWMDDTPAWSRDGKRIAFARGNGGAWRIYVVNVGGGHARPLTARMPLADSPSWSPGDAWIAFAGSTPNFVQQIYVVPARGAGARRLTSLRGGAARPAWSPDGRLIIFAGKASGAAHQRPDLWVIRPDGSGLRRLIADGTDPAWSPDGRTIVFVRGTQIYLAAANGTHQRQLTATLTEKETPSWAPSGSSIVFGDGDPAEGEALDEVRAGAAAADSQQLQNITASVHGLWAAAPAWQPAVP